MPIDRLDIRPVLALAAITLLVALAASRLSPHEAIGGQTAREMIASGDLLVPRIDGRPWLEKPPLVTWMIAAAGLVRGRVTEPAARLPSALAALLLTLGVAEIAARRLGPRVGMTAGLVQAAMPWLILRGRLAEVDVTLAALVVGAMVALDRVRMGSDRARWAFFALLGATALAKGIGFGAALVGATALAVLVWDRDARTLRSLLSPVGIALSLAIALPWPILVLRRYPEALGLWTLHVTDRFASRPSHFAGEPWGEYLLTPVVQTLPWTVFALAGAWRSARAARGERGGLDRLLWAWAVVPAAMVSLASARNGHYLIHALPPLSIWAAMALGRLGDRLRDRGWTDRRVARAAAILFASLGLGWAAGFAAIGPRLNPRSAELAFYERARDLVPADEPLVLLYDLERPDRWDREPYPTPFGPVPADLASRLFSLDRPATWRSAADDLLARPPSVPFAAIGRERDASALAGSGGSRSSTAARPLAGTARSSCSHGSSSPRPPSVARQDRFATPGCLCVLLHERTGAVMSGLNVPARSPSFERPNCLRTQWRYCLNEECNAAQAGAIKVLVLMAGAMAQDKDDARTDLTRWRELCLCLVADEKASEDEVKKRSGHDKGRPPDRMNMATNRKRRVGTGQSWDPKTQAK